MFIQDEVNPILQVEALSYAIQFNIDISGSMSGSKWRSVCDSVDNLVSYLGPNDLIAGMVFNDKVIFLDIEPNQGMTQRINPPSNRS